MFSFDDIKNIQVEITNRCQASCPMCLRNIHGGIKNPNLKTGEWSLDQFLTVFTPQVLSHLERFTFCGDFGDPILNNDLIDMCKYLKDQNVPVAIITNGSARTAEWWSKLAESLPKDHYVEFALDGLADTHSLHRIGTSYELVIRNAQKFIQSGGRARWMFIEFAHNQHQINQARELSKELGFESFLVKTSKRFGNKFPVLNSQGKITHFLEQPSYSDIKPVEFLDLKDYKNWKREVICETYNLKELYIDAHGHMMPCCIIGSFLYSNYDVELYRRYNLINEKSIIGIAQEVQKEVWNLIEEFGGLDNLDVFQYGIKSIMDRPLWKELMHKKWKEYSSSPCMILCGAQGPFIRVSEQINRTVSK